MRMPPPPGELGTKDRLFAWIGRHKVASGLIGLLAFLLIVTAISSSAGGVTPSDQAAPSSPAATLAAASPSKPPQPEVAKVPSVKGLSAQQARSSLEDAGFAVTIVKNYSDRAPGTLLLMSADAGTKMEVGSSVSLSVAKAYPTVPYVLGMTQDKATSKLKGAGYNVVVNKQESSQTSGTVITVDPAVWHGSASGKIGDHRRRQGPTAAATATSAELHAWVLAMSPSCVGL
jgi:PASTA domain